MGLSVWCTDQAGPFQTIPQPGTSWRPEGDPDRHPHEYIRHGTAKVMTLFHPADGQARVKGVTTCPNEVLHGWLKEEPSSILAALPPVSAPSDAMTLRSAWQRWQEGRLVKPTLADELPPLRMLLVLHNLVVRQP